MPFLWAYKIVANDKIISSVFQLTRHTIRQHIHICFVILYLKKMLSEMSFSEACASLLLESINLSEFSVNRRNIVFHC